MSPSTPAHHHARLAIFFVLWAYACFSLGDALMKLLAQDYSLSLILACNGVLISALSFGGLVIMGKVSALWQSPNASLHLTRAGVVSILSYLSAFSIQHIPLPDFYGIVFLSPFLISLYAAVILKEEVGKHRILGMVSGFIGVLILAGPELQSMNIGYITTFVMLFILVGHIILIRHIGNNDPWPLYSFFPGLGLMACGFFDIGSLSIPNLTWDGVVILLIEALAVFAGQIALARAYAIAPLAALIAPYVYTQMLWGILYGWLLFHMTPSVTTLIGGGVIILSGLAPLLYDRYLRPPSQA